MRKLFLLPLLCLLALASCREDKEAPAPQPAPEAPETPVPEPDAPEVPFSFRYDPDAKYTEELELIVSQDDGQVLLDTVIAARVEHQLTVRSADTAFDVTTIYLDPAINRHSMRTYVQVNPDNWDIRERVIRPGFDASEEAIIHYKNVPTIERMVFTGKQTTGRGISYGAGSLNMMYYRLLPADLAYLMIPDAGKYLFTEVTSSTTHADFSEATPTTNLNFSKPEGVTDVSSILYGYTEAGEYLYPMELYGASQRLHPGAYDLQYPQTGIEEYELVLSYTDAEGSRHTYVHVGDAVPAELPFLPKADFTVTKAEAGDFQVGFGEDRPVSYRMVWSSSNASLNADWSIYLPAEEASFNPKGFLARTGAAYLEGKDLTGFTLSSLTTYTAKGYTHQGIQDRRNFPELFLRTRWALFRQVHRDF